MKTNTNIIAECPSCGEMVYFAKFPRLGQYIDCRYCEEELEVIDLQPLLLDWPIEEDNYDNDLYEDTEDDW